MYRISDCLHPKVPKVEAFPEHLSSDLFSEGRAAAFVGFLRSFS